MFGAYLSHSIAIFTDALHLSSDLIGFLLSLYSLYYSERKNPFRTFGNGRAEALGALASIMIIWLMVAYITYEATLRLIDIL